MAHLDKCPEGNSNIAMSCIQNHTCQYGIEFDPVPNLDYVCYLL